jgi:hypothetical protein
MNVSKYSREISVLNIILFKPVKLFDFWTAMYCVFRVEKISQEFTTNVEQYKETIEHLTVKNETLAKTYKV